MSKQIYVKTLNPLGGPAMGQVADALDIMKAQEFLHQHVEQVTADHITGGVVTVAGFAYLIQEGLSLSIGPGRITDDVGKSYEPNGATVVPIMPAHPTLPRIDIIYGMLEAAKPAVLELRPFINLDSDALSETITATEKHNLVTVSVRSGLPAEIPDQPTINAGEVPLWMVRVRPGATSIIEDDIVDLRDQVRPLREAWAELVLIRRLIDSITGATGRLPAANVDIGQGAGEFTGHTVQEFINIYVNRSQQIKQASRSPEILRPDLEPIDPDRGTLGAEGVVALGQPSVDMPAGSQVQFGETVLTIEPQMFDPSVDARLINTNPDVGEQEDRKDTLLTPAAIIETGGDGGSRFMVRNALLPTARYQVGSASRGLHYIELFGGLGVGGPLSEWLTYDTDTDTLTVRTVSGDALPPTPRPHLLPMGVGDNRVLVGCSHSGGVAQWFKVDAVTMVSTEIDGGPAQAMRIRGDLIQPNIIFITAEIDAAPYRSFWIYNVADNSFAEINPAGEGPTGRYIRGQSVCVYTPGKALYYGTSDLGSESFIFDYAASTWTKLNIPQPTIPGASGEDSLVRGSLRNLFGRPTLFAMGNGEHTVWELDPTIAPAWRAISQTNAPHRLGIGIASMRSTSLTEGPAYGVGGRDAALTLQRDVYRYDRGGIVATVDAQGQPAITLGPNATFGVFELPVFILNFEVADVFTTLVGQIPPGSVKLEYSLDDGETFQTVQANTTTPILSSSNPGRRHLRVKMYSSGSTSPVLSKILERFESVGATGFSELVLRYDIDGVAAAQHALYLDDTGLITFSADITPSTSSKAILLKVTPNGALAPTVKNFINKQHIHLLREGTRAGGVTPPITNDLSRLPSFIHAWLKLADGTMKYLAAPAVEFDTDIPVPGIATNGDGYVVELEA